MSIFNKLFDGNICPFEMPRVNSPKSEELKKEIHECMQAFENKLPPNDYSMLEQLYCALNDYNCMEYPRYFAYGFKLATVMMCESMGILSEE